MQHIRKGSRFGLFVMTMLAGRSAAAETLVLEDSLLGKTIGTQVGGMLGPEGYTPGGAGPMGGSKDHIL
jgi:hypothetical protein